MQLHSNTARMQHQGLAGQSCPTVYLARSHISTIDIRLEDQSTSTRKARCMSNGSYRPTRASTYQSHSWLFVHEIRKLYRFLQDTFFVYMTWLTPSFERAFVCIHHETASPSSERRVCWEDHRPANFVTLRCSAQKLDQGEGEGKRCACG